MADRFLTSLQRRHITQTIRDGHLAFLAEMFGPMAIDHDDYVRLRASGKIRDEKLLPQDAALAAHSLGALAGEEQATALASMRAEAEREHIAHVHSLPPSIVAREFDVAKPPLLTPDEFWRRVRDDPQVITEAEREAVSILRDRVGQHVRGLGNKLDAATGHILVDADDKLRRHRLTKLQREIVRGVDEQAEASDVAKRIRAATQDLKRDWLRTAHTEMHNAVEEAKAIVLAHRSPERDPRVFKRPRPDACVFCVLLYLKADKVTPRVFKLSELLANGSNVGRRAGRPTLSGRSRTQWKAVVGAVHPFCFPAGSLVTTGRGQVPIEQIHRGDVVWTHAGRWRPVMQVSKRSYADDLVVVSWVGGEVAATKEHPFLTERGWISAEHLRDTDHALEVVPSEVTTPEVGHEPAFAREREQLQGVLALLLRAEVPVATVDLYRDLCCWYGDVDAVDADSMDRRYFDASFAERFHEFVLQLGEFLVSLGSARTVKFLRERLLLSPQGLVRCIREALTFFVIELAHAKVHLLAGCPGCDSCADESGDHGATARAEGFRYSQYGQLSLVENDDLLGGDVGSAHLAMASRFSTIVNVKSRRQAFVGDVYNLHVEEDESFVCNGLVVHNCRCPLQVLPAGMGFNARGQMVYVGTMKSIDVEKLDKSLVTHHCED